MSIGLDAPILPTSPNHEDWIKKALRLADKAFSEGEVPVGAVIVKENKSNIIFDELYNFLKLSSENNGTLYKYAAIAKSSFK